VSLDDKLWAILSHHTYDTDRVEAIKQAFADESGLTKLMQDMVNTHANMKYDALRLGLSHSGEKYMTGQEWLDTYNKALKQIVDDTYGPELEPVELPVWLVYEVARKAAGIK